MSAALVRGGLGAHEVALALWVREVFVVVRSETVTWVMNRSLNLFFINK